MLSSFHSQAFLEMPYEGPQESVNELVLGNHELMPNAIPSQVFLVRFVNAFEWPLVHHFKEGSTTSWLKD